MISLEEARDRWIRERPRYNRFVDHMKVLLRERVRQAGIPCVVEGRTKDVGGFVKKAYKRRYRNPWKSITDKAGVRVVVLHLDQVTPIKSIIEQTFVIVGTTNKSGELRPDQFGYRGFHYDVTLQPRDLQVEQREFRHLRCEVQINTAAERCWADVSHELAYKPGIAAPPEVARKLNRLVALVELFDEQVDSAKSIIMSQNGFEEAAMLEALSTRFHALTVHPYDRELSLDVIGKLKGLYLPEQLDHFGDLLDDFLARRGGDLASLYRSYANDDRFPLFLFQPESILLFERLQADRFTLAEEWDTHFERRYLVEMADVWAVPLS